MHLYICIFFCVYSYLHICIHVHTRTNKHVYTQANTQAHIYTHTHTHTHTRTWTWVSHVHHFLLAFRLQLQIIPWQITCKIHAMHINESRNTYDCVISYDIAQRLQLWTLERRFPQINESHGKCECVMLHTYSGAPTVANTSKPVGPGIYIYMNMKHGTCDSVMAHINGSWHILLSHVAGKRRASEYTSYTI